MKVEFNRSAPMAVYLNSLSKGEVFVFTREPMIPHIVIDKHNNTDVVIVNLTSGQRIRENGKLTVYRVDGTFKYTLAN